MIINNKKTWHCGLFDASGVDCIVEGNNDYEFSLIARMGKCPNSSQNAQLISAAPDLLEALQAVLSANDSNTREFDLARSAVAKAIQS